MKKVWILVALAGPLSAQVATEANTQYRSPDGRKGMAANLSTPQSLGNVTLIKGTEKDPSLREAAVDEALVLDAYHHFDYPEAMLASIHKALKPGGKLEIEANHFRLVSEREQIKDVQYMLVLEKN